MIPIDRLNTNDNAPSLRKYIMAAMPPIFVVSSPIESQQGLS
jgi:hypothetical protein